LLAAVLAVTAAGDLERRLNLETHAAAEATAGNKTMI
jgi:hypothetical protein